MGLRVSLPSRMATSLLGMARFMPRLARPAALAASLAVPHLAGCSGGTEHLPTGSAGNGDISAAGSGYQVGQVDTIHTGGTAGESHSGLSMPTGGSVNLAGAAGMAGETAMGGTAGLAGAAGMAGVAGFEQVETPTEAPDELLNNPIVAAYFGDHWDGKMVNMRLQVRVETAEGLPITYSGLQDKTLRIRLASDSTAIPALLSGNPGAEMPCVTGLCPTSTVAGAYTLADRFSQDMTSEWYSPYEPVQVYVESVQYFDLRSNPVAEITRTYATDELIVGSSCEIDPVIAQYNPAIDHGPLSLEVPAELYKTGANAGIAYFDVVFTLSMRNVGMTYEPFAYNAIASVTAE